PIPPLKYRLTSPPPRSVFRQLVKMSTAMQVICAEVKPLVMSSSVVQSTEDLLQKPKTPPPEASAVKMKLGLKTSVSLPVQGEPEPSMRGSTTSALAAAVQNRMAVKANTKARPAVFFDIMTCTPHLRVCKLQANGGAGGQRQHTIRVTLARHCGWRSGVLWGRLQAVALNLSGFSLVRF